MIQLPLDHDQRLLLNNEVHARPPDAYMPPTRTAFLALFNEGLSREAGSAPIRDLARRFGLEPPAAEANHFSADLGPFRVTWERHTEFSRYSFIEQGDDEVLFEKSPVRLVPREWLAAVPGRTIVAAHLILARAPATMPDVDTLSAQYFAGNILIGARVADGAATAITDFRITADGFSRMLLFDHGLAPRQAGRTVQRLLEIDAYRILATMALPVARELTPFLSHSEAELSEVTAAMTTASTADEPRLLDQLIKLEAEIESRRSTTANRFNAANAYYDLVQRRIDELRESRLPGLQTFKELTERRLVPAMNTCKAVSARQDALSLRVTRATQLLSTRVDITREKQNQAVLESMNRRAKQQLRLQQTVEGLSVAAVTYYVVGLIYYVFKGLSAAGAALQPDLVVALSIPIVALLVAGGLRGVRKPATKAPLPREAKEQTKPET
jgi:uncharacterized membrane-anchored protein